MAKEIRFDLSSAGIGKGIFIAFLLLVCSADKLGSETYSLTTAYPAMYGSFSKIKVRDYFQVGTVSGRVRVGHFTDGKGVVTRGIQAVDDSKSFYLYSSGGITIGEQPLDDTYTQFVDLVPSVDNTDKAYFPNMCKWVPFVVGAEQFCDADLSRKYIVIAFGPSGNTATSSQITLSTCDATGKVIAPDTKSGSMLCCRIAPK